MNKITSINKSKFNIFVTFDSGYKLRLPLKSENMLQKDMIVDINELVEEFSEEMLAQALDLSYRYLSYSMRLENEVKEYLLKKNFPENTVYECLNSLLESGYLNDEAYAIEYMKGRIHASYGRKKISFELEKKGLDSDTVQDLMERCFPYDEERECLSEYLDRLNTRYSSLFLREKKDKIINSSLRRGYSYDIISEIIDEHVFEDDGLVNDRNLRLKIRNRFNREMSRGLDLEQARYKVFPFFYRKGYSNEILESVYEEMSGETDQ